MVCLRFICVMSLCSWMTPSGSGENICPPVTELLSQQTVIADVNGSDFSSFIWRRPSDNEGVFTCDIAKNLCIQTHPGYSGTVSSSTRTSRLNISSIQKKDSGMWTLEAGTTDVDVCNLVTVRKPHCNIKSNIEADDLDLGDNLTLTVTITGYYCSKGASFSLTTGDVTQIVIQNHTMEDRTDKDSYDKALSTTFDVSLARFGDVVLEYSCADATWTVTCDRIRKLVISRPQCNISSRDADDFDLGDEVTLTVDIKGYYCPELAKFTLTTGDVTDVLLGEQTVDDVTDAIKNDTFTMTLARFGHINVDYICGRDTRRLTCEGVKELVYTRPQCNITTRDADDLGDEVTLTVDIKGYYCPELAKFTLTIGDVTDVLLGNQTVDDVTDAIRKDTFTMTLARFGHINVDYICGGDTRRLTCGGVKELVYNKVSSTSPQSKTTSEKTSIIRAPESATTPDPGLPIPIIVGTSVGGLLLILIVVVIIIVARRKLLGIADKHVVQKYRMKVSKLTG